MQYFDFFNSDICVKQAIPPEASLSDRLFCNHHAHPLRQTWAYRQRYAKEVSVGFKPRLKPWYISIPSNPNLYSTQTIIKCDGKQLQAMFQYALSATLPPHYQKLMTV